MAKQNIAISHAKIVIFFLRNVYASADHTRYEAIPHKLKYPAISSNDMCASLRYDRRKNLSIETNTLRKNVIATKIIIFLCFMFVIFYKKVFLYACAVFLYAVSSNHVRFSDFV